MLEGVVVVTNLLSRQIIYLLLIFLLPSKNQMIIKWSRIKRIAMVANWFEVTIRQSSHWNEDYVWWNIVLVEQDSFLQFPDPHLSAAWQTFRLGISTAGVMSCCFFPNEIQPPIIFVTFRVELFGHLYEHFICPHMCIYTHSHVYARTHTHTYMLKIGKRLKRKKHKQETLKNTT